jgi:soluble lytic murein transglycosylase-like protein
MTVVLIVSTGIVTTAAFRVGPAPRAISVCPGARTVRAPTTSVPGSVTNLPTGSLPAPLVAQPVRLRLLPLFEQWASVCAVPVALVEATCWWESGWQEGVVSVTGAVGVCQIEPAAAQTVRGLLDDGSLDPRSSSDNIEMSAAYLRWLLDETGGRRDLALASYYQGLTSVREHGILAVSRPYVTGITALLRDYSWS